MGTHWSRQPHRLAAARADRRAGEVESWGPSGGATDGQTDEKGDTGWLGERESESKREPDGDRERHAESSSSSGRAQLAAVLQSFERSQLRRARSLHDIQATHSLAQQQQRSLWRRRPTRLASAAGRRVCASSWPPCSSRGASRSCGHFHSLVVFLPSSLRPFLQSRRCSAAPAPLSASASASVSAPASSSASLPSASSVPVEVALARRQLLRRRRRRQTPAWGAASTKAPTAPAHSPARPPACSPASAPLASASASGQLPLQLALSTGSCLCRPHHTTTKGSPGRLPLAAVCLRLAALFLSLSLCLWHTQTDTGTNRRS